MEIKKAKKRLRKILIAKRRNLDPISRVEQTKIIAQKFFALPEYATAKTIGFYASKAEEISADGVMMRALAEGKRVVLPRVVDKNLFWHEIKSLKQLRVGSFAIREPRADLPKIRVDQIDLLVVPSVGFDERGNRLGFGGGFYDKVLSEFKGASVGFAFDIQVVEKIPTESWDQKVSKVLVGK